MPRRYTRPSSDPTVDPADPTSAWVWPGFPTTLTVAKTVRPKFLYKSGGPVKERYLYSLELSGSTAEHGGTWWVGEDSLPYDADDKSKEKKIAAKAHYLYVDKERFSPEDCAALSKEDCGNAQVTIPQEDGAEVKLAVIDPEAGVRPLFKYNDDSPAKDVFLYVVEFSGTTASPKGTFWLGSDSKPYDPTDKTTEKGIPLGKFYFYGEDELFPDELIGALSKKDCGEVEHEIKADTEEIKLPFKVGEPKVVDLPDPELREKHREDSNVYARIDGEVEVDGISGTDVIQGSIADCYFVAAMASVAHKDPDIIQKSLKKNPDGTVRVRFFEKRYVRGKGFQYQPTYIKVDRDFVKKDSRKLLYARWAQETEDGKPELWPALVEKAYAAWKGGYDDMGEGGNSSAALSALAGKDTDYKSNSSLTDDALYKFIKKALDDDHPIVTGTFGKDRSDLYEGVRLYAWHCYSIWGAEEKNDKQWVQLRNPWGSTEPSVNPEGPDGDKSPDDGIFWLTVADYKKYYKYTTVCKS